MRETSKAYQRRKNDPFWNDVFIGDGLDIGSGDDPFHAEWFPNVRSIKLFDLKDGDAQYITRYEEPAQYDFVHSSNCLEHLVGVPEALFGWLHLVKPGGHLVFTVPDEDSYEQGIFPSRWNADHKWTFTLYKHISWNPRSINLARLFDVLPSCKVSRVGLIDTNYNYSLKDVDQTAGNAEAFWEVVIHKLPVVPRLSTYGHSGARGDLVYALATIRAMGGGKLYINHGIKSYFSFKVDDNEFNEIKKFIESQGIAEVENWDGQAVEHNLDVFRQLRVDYNRLFTAHLMAFGVHHSNHEPWIDPKKVIPICEADIVVSRTNRYHGTFDWQELKPWLSRCVFVGSEGEHFDFQKITGMIIRYVKTNTWTELAGVIRGGKLFVGNQSLAYALAEGMKVPRVLETFQDCPNCDPLGGDGHIRLTQGVIRRYVLGEENADEFGKSRNPWMFTHFKSTKRQTVVNPSTCLVIPGCCQKDKIELILAEAKARDISVVVQEDGNSFEEMVRLGVAKTNSQFICVADVDADVSCGDIEMVRNQLLGGKAGLAGTTMFMKFRPHVSGPVIAVTRRAYEQLGFFNLAMFPGELNLVEMNLRYERGMYGCKSASLAKWAKWEGRSVPEWEERNIKYIEKVYGIKI